MMDSPTRLEIEEILAFPAEGNTVAERNMFRTGMVRQHLSLHYPALPVEIIVNDLLSYKGWEAEDA